MTDAGTVIVSSILYLGLLALLIYGIYSLIKLARTNKCFDSYNGICKSITMRDCIATDLMGHTQVPISPAFQEYINDSNGVIEVGQGNSIIISNDNRSRVIKTISRWIEDSPTFENSNNKPLGLIKEMSNDYIVELFSYPQGTTFDMSKKEPKSGVYNFSAEEGEINNENIFMNYTASYSC